MKNRRVLILVIALATLCLSIGLSVNNFNKNHPELKLEILDKNRLSEFQEDLVRLKGYFKSILNKF